MRRMNVRITLLASAVAVAVLIAAQTAGAAVTIGSDLSGPADDAFGCGGNCTLVHSQIAGQIAQAPTDGVVVRWRIKTDSPGGPFALQVVRPATGDERTGIATSAQVSTAGAGISVFPTRLAIKQGDNIGLQFTSANLAKFAPDGSDPGTTTLYFQPAIADWQTDSPTFVNVDSEFLVNADIEPDGDSDGFGDETQDKCLGQPGESEGCDRLVPTGTLTTFPRMSYRRLRATLHSSEPASMVATATVTVRSGKRKTVYRAKTVKFTFATSVAKTFRFKFTRKTSSQLKKLIERKRKLKAVVSFRLVDFAGNTSTVSGVIALKR